MKGTQKKTLITAATLCIAVAATSFAFAADATKAQEDAAEYRQSTFNMVGYHTGALGAMAKGKVDFDAAEFTKNAEALAALAKMAPIGFEVEGAVGKSRSEAKVWEDKEGFAEKMTAFQTATAALAEVAQTGDKDKSLAAFGDVGKTCKGCHTEYRGKKK